MQTTQKKRKAEVQSDGRSRCVGGRRRGRLCWRWRRWNRCWRTYNAYCECILNGCFLKSKYQFLLPVIAGHICVLQDWLSIRFVGQALTEKYNMILRQLEQTIDSKTHNPVPACAVVIIRVRVCWPLNNNKLFLKRIKNNNKEFQVPSTSQCTSWPTNPIETQKYVAKNHTKYTSYSKIIPHRNNTIDWTNCRSAGLLLSDKLLILNMKKKIYIYIYRLTWDSLKAPQFGPVEIVIRVLDCIDPLRIIIC